MKRFLQNITLLLLLGTGACQPRFEMVPPGAGGTVQEFDENVYVTANGAGKHSGADWNNAISFKTFLSRITSEESMLSYTAFHIQQGEYLVTSKNAYQSISGDVCCIRGGYSQASQYDDLSLCDPNLYPTVFTGDVNKNGVADDGDGAFAYVTNGNVRFDNIIFKNFYLSETLASNLGGKGSAVFGINGSYFSTSVECNNCRFEGNVNGVTDPSKNSWHGGPCSMLSQGYLKLRNCILRDNNAYSRGGAIRINGSKGVLFLDRCLFTGNQITESYGSAIQGSSGVICMNNSSLVGNIGKGGVLNGGGAFLVANSTLIDNSEPDDNCGAFRCVAPADRESLFINSVFSNENADGYGLVLSENGTVVSKGFNLYKSVKANAGSTSPVVSSDTEKNVVLTGSIQGNTWMWDVSQVMADLRGFAIVDDIYDAVVSFDPIVYTEIAVLGRTFANWVTPISFAKDARGAIRGDDRYQPGAYDPNID